MPLALAAPQPHNTRLPASIRFPLSVQVSSLFWIFEWRHVQLACIFNTLQWFCVAMKSLQHVPKVNYTIITATIDLCDFELKWRSIELNGLRKECAFCDAEITSCKAIRWALENKNDGILLKCKTETRIAWQWTHSTCLIVVVFISWFRDGLMTYLYQLE